MKKWLSSAIAFTLFMEILTGSVSAYIQEASMKSEIITSINQEGELVTNDEYGIVDKELYRLLTNHEGKVLRSEISLLKELVIPKDVKVTTLKGIENIINLEKISIETSTLTNLEGVELLANLKEIKVTESLKGTILNYKILSQSKSLENITLENIESKRLTNLFGSEHIKKITIKLLDYTEETALGLSKGFKELNPNIQTLIIEKYEYTNIVDEKIPMSFDKCDVNTDGKVDQSDLDLVSSHYGEVKGSPLWDDKYDINEDGIIDIFDLTLVSKKMEATPQEVKALITQFYTNVPSGQLVNEKITINAESNLDKDVLYEFSVMSDDETEWKILKSFDNNKTVEWIPTKTGCYVLRLKTKHINSKLDFDDEVEITFNVIGNIKDGSLLLGRSGKVQLNEYYTPLLALTYDDGKSAYVVPDKIECDSTYFKVNEDKSITAIAAGTSKVTAVINNKSFSQDITIDNIQTIKDNYDKFNTQTPLQGGTINLNVTAISTEEGIKLGWTQYPFIDKYLVYKKSLGGEFVKLTESTGNEYIDNQVVKDEFYTYRIDIIRKDGRVEKLKEIGIISDKGPITPWTRSDNSNIIDESTFVKLNTAEFKQVLINNQKDYFTSDGLKDEVFAYDPIGADDTKLIKKMIDRAKFVQIVQAIGEKSFSIYWTSVDVSPYRSKQGDLWIKPTSGFKFTTSLTRINFNKTKGLYEYGGTFLNRPVGEFAIDTNGSYVYHDVNADGTISRGVNPNSKKYVLRYTTSDGTIVEPSRYFPAEAPQYDKDGNLISINKTDVSSEEMQLLTRGLTFIDPALTPYKEGDNIVIVANNGEPFLATVMKIEEPSGSGKFKYIAYPIKFNEYQEANKNIDQLRLLSTILDFTLIAGPVKEIVEFAIGQDVITGETLNRLAMLGVVFGPELTDMGFKYLAKKGIVRGDGIISGIVDIMGTYGKRNSNDVFNNIIDHLRQDKKKLYEYVTETIDVGGKNGSIICKTIDGGEVTIPKASLTKMDQKFLLEGIKVVDETLTHVIKEGKDAAGNVVIRYVVPKGFNSVEDFLRTVDMDSIKKYGYDNVTEFKNAVENVNNYLNASFDNTIVNQTKAGTVYNGVEFNVLGFPVFKDADLKFTHRLSETLLQAKDTPQFRECTEALRDAINKGTVSETLFTDDQVKAIKAGLPRLPDLRWHHNEVTGKMQLVTAKPHDVNHLGGNAMWGGGLR